MTEIKYFQMGEKDILSNITGNLSMIYCYFILCQFLMQRMIKNPIHYSQSSLFLCILSSNSPFSLQTHKSWPPEKNVLSSFMFTKHWENIKRCCLWAIPFSHFLHVQNHENMDTWSKYSLSSNLTDYLKPINFTLPFMFYLIHEKCSIDTTSQCTINLYMKNWKQKKWYVGRKT